MDILRHSLLFTWLRDPRFSLGNAKSPDGLDDGTLFLPVEISASAAASDSTNGVAGTHRSADAQPLAQRVDITLSDSRRILVEGPTSLAAVLELVLGLLP